MNKNAVKVIIIILAFGASGAVLYYGGIFGGTKKTPAQTLLLNNGNLAGLLPPGTEGAVDVGPQEILPSGDSLDFSKAVDKTRFNYNQVKYPKLDPVTEVGIKANELIAPKPVEVKAEGQ